MTPSEFDTAVARLREVKGGRVEVTDFFPRGREPYRYATLKVEASRAEAPLVAAAIAEVAIQVSGHVSMYTHAPTIAFDISVSRELTGEEIGDEPPCASREVATYGGDAG
jgi:hypothetical protein